MTQPISKSNKEIIDICKDLTNNHHVYLRKFGPRLMWRNQAIKNLHIPEFKQFKVILTELLRELTPHLLKEEVLVFPYCQRLALATETYRLPGGTMTESIHQLKNEHDHWTQKIHELEALVQLFAPKLVEISGYQDWLKEFEKFTLVFKQLLYTENDVLFPKVLALEQQLFNH